MTMIKPIEAFSRMSDGELAACGGAVQFRMTGNSNFPNPPVDLETLRTDLDNFSALMAESFDGSKKVIAAKNSQRAEIISRLRLLARYVEVTCKNDLSMFVSSGFTMAGTRTVSQSLSERIRSITHGANSGDVVFRLSALPGASSYEVRFAPASAGSASPQVWATQPVTNIRNRITLKGLTPGVTYLFQARAVINNSYTDWTDSVTFICT